MTRQEVCDKILNKKFEKSVFSGYQTTDVDNFFDYVIEFLKQSEIDVEAFKKTSEALKKENEDLKTTLQANSLTIAKLTKQIKQYEEDGYANVSENERKQEAINNKGE